MRGLSKLAAAIATVAVLLTAPIRSGSVESGQNVSGQLSLASRGAGLAVVYLEGGGVSVKPSHAMIDQREKAFIPHVTAIPVGSTVDFPNNDTVFHNVFAYYQAKKFDLGMYPRGATKRITFDKPGVVALLCNVHSDMSAYILVVDSPYYAVADGQGRFTLRNVPPGTYTLHGWHESGAVGEMKINVPGDSARIALTLRRK